MDEEPGVQPAVEAFLFLELAGFVANIFEIVDGAVDGGREKGAQAGEGELCFGGVAKKQAALARALQIRAHFIAIKAAERSALIFAEKENFRSRGYGGATASGSSNNRAHSSGAATMNDVVVSVFGKTQIATDGLNVLIGFGAQHSADVGNFVVDGFEWNVGGHDARNVMLDGRAQYAAEDGEDEEPHQNLCKSAAEMKSSMKEN